MLSNWLATVAIYSALAAQAISKPNERERDLVALVQTNIPDLTSIEKEFIRNTARDQGEFFVSTGDTEKDDPGKGDQWGPERTIRAKVINFLCTDNRASELIPPRGIFVSGVRVTGVIDLAASRVRFPLIFLFSRFDNHLEFTNAQVKELGLSGSCVRGIDGNGLRVSDGLSLNKGFHATEGVQVAGAVIGGDFSCDGGKFEDPMGAAISADNIDVAGDVGFSSIQGIRFESLGGIRLNGAAIGGSLFFDGGQFRSEDRHAIAANGINVAGSVFMQSSDSHRFESFGTVSLCGASIGGSLYCNGKFENRGGDTILGDDLRVTGSVGFGDCSGQIFESLGTVRIAGATIGGNLRCNGKFENRGGDTVVGDEFRVTGSVMFGDCSDQIFESIGTLRIPGATIGGNLDFTGARLENPGGEVLDACGIRVRRDLYFCSSELNRFQSFGSILLAGAAIGGDLICTGAKLENPLDETIFADHIQVTGQVLLNSGGDYRFESRGCVRFDRAVIGSDLFFEGGKFSNPENSVISAHGIRVNGSVIFRDFTKNLPCEITGKVNMDVATVAGHFQWLVQQSPQDALLDLRDSVVGVLKDDQWSWPEKGNIWLDRFHYKHISHGAPTDAARRLDWLRRQHQEPGEPFNPEPFEHCAAVLKSMGHAADARAILIAKEEDQAAQHWDSMSALSRVWHWLLSVTVGHGYEPLQVWRPCIGIVGLGALVFFLGRWGGVMQPTNDRAFRTSGNTRKALRHDYPTFNPFVYSLDEFLPIINLRQGDHWVPNKDDILHDRAGFFGFLLRRFAQLLRVYLWFHILAGWLLTTLFIAGVTGLLRK